MLDAVCFEKWQRRVEAAGGTWEQVDWSQGNGWGASVFMARAAEDGEQCSGSLASVFPLLYCWGSCPQTEGGDGFICCLVRSLVITEEEAHTEPLLAWDWG